MFSLLMRTVGVIGVVFLTISIVDPSIFAPVPPHSTQTIAYSSVFSDPGPVITATSTPTTTATSAPEIKKTIEQPVPKPVIAPSQAVDIEENEPAPLPPAKTTQPAPVEAMNTKARAALVNILCKTTGQMVRPISGTGVIIDPRGIILTNAHVAQYVLLASRSEVSLSCVIRGGSPATNRWNADLLYIPSTWINTHASDIRNSRPLGTGEYDFALLAITSSVDGSSLPSTFPHVSFDTRSPASILGDTVVLAGYPAEFANGNTTQSNLHISSAIAQIRQFLTFEQSTIDVLSLGGVVLAQSGSSGGAVINTASEIIGLLSTTSEGATTAERDLHAITLYYINRYLQSHENASLIEFLNGDPRQLSAEFMKNEAPALSQKLIDALSAN